MIRIPLTKGYFTLIDEADLPLIGEYNWWARASIGYVYAMRTRRSGEAGPVSISMHRQILGVAVDLHVDHRNGDTLDNRRSNLRACSAAENHRNTRRVRAVSGLKGVQQADAGKWKGTITVSKKVIHLGTFETPEAAARAYDAAAIEHFGEFAATNESLGLLRGAL